jgi:hypothetical protein
MAEQKVPGGEVLQAAALQLIAAARQFLDAAEHVVLDPDAVKQATSTAAAIAKGVIEAVVPNAGGPMRADAPVEHIDLGD